VDFPNRTTKKAQKNVLRNASWVCHKVWEIHMNAFYGADIQGDFETYELGNFKLECGETLRGAKLAYRALGTLERRTVSLNRFGIRKSVETWFNVAWR
jgi:hypothetical protein